MQRESGGSQRSWPDRLAPGAVALLYVGVLGGSYAAATGSWLVGLASGGALLAGAVVLCVVLR